MAQTNLSQDDIKALEHTRQRIFQLTNNLVSVRGDVLRGNPLPEWSSLQTSAAILSANIQSLTAHLSKHSDLLNRTVVYPATTFPGRTQEQILQHLLRKKLDPAVETWVEEGLAIQSGLHSGGSSEADEEKFLEGAEKWLNERIAKYVAEDGDNYTVEERERGVETVNTGLKRKFDDDDSDEDEDEDEEMKDVGSINTDKPSLPEVKRDPNGKTRSVADILRLATSGVVIEGGLGRR